MLIIIAAALVREDEPRWWFVSEARAAESMRLAPRYPALVPTGRRPRRASHTHAIVDREVSGD